MNRHNSKNVVRNFYFLKYIFVCGTEAFVEVGAKIKIIVSFFLLGHLLQLAGTLLSVKDFLVISRRYSSH